MVSRLQSLFGLLVGRGSSRNDLIIGSERGERFDAKGGNDWINAAGGDDTVVGGKGNDFVGGGPGTDTAVFSGSVRSYSWVTLPFSGAPGPLGFAGNLIRITGPDGTDWLRDIEFLKFNDALIQVGTVNAAPVAVADTYQVYEDLTLTAPASGVLANDSDPDNNSLTALLVSGVAHGTLNFSGDGSFTYTPNADYFGADSFTYKANDGTTDGNTVTVSIEVTRNGAPVVQSLSKYNVDEDNTLTVLAATGVLSDASDPDANGITAILVSGVAHGTLDLHADGSFTYTPDDDYFGADSFSFKPNDGIVDGDTVVVSIDVDPVNDVPVALQDIYSVDEDDTLTVPIAGVLSNDSDVDNDSLTAILFTDVANGTLSLAGDGSFTYTPDADFYGEDSFTYKVNDGTEDGNTVTVTITVDPVNDAPIAEDDEYNVDEDDTLTVPIAGVLSNDSDPESDTLAAILVSDVDNGTLYLEEDGSFTYIPFEDFNGEDSFTYKASDGTDDSDTVTVTITVDPVNDAPVAEQDRYDFGSGGVVVSAVNGVLSNDTDVDLDTLTAILVDTTENGQLTFNSDGSFEYVRNASGGDTDRFTYKANDGTADSDYQVVFLDLLF